MGTEYCPRSALHIYLAELGAQVAAESGIASDCYHLGKLILTSLKTHPEWTLQVDASTKKSESSKSVLYRSIKCAKSMQRHGVGLGDIVVLMAPNHIDLSIPFYAANYLGASFMPIDAAAHTDNITTFFETANPKIIFCHAEKANDVKTAMDSVKIKAEIITFDASDKHTTFEELMNESDEEININEFRVTDFDTKDTLCFLAATSGSTGLPKLTSVTHRSYTLGLTQYWSNFTEFPMHMKLFCTSTLQWTTGVDLYYTSAIFGFTRVQTSARSTTEHYLDIIHQYKPNIFFEGPTLLHRLLHHPESNKYDFSGFNTFYVGGSFVNDDLLTELKVRIPHASVMVGYGMTEVCGMVMCHSGHPTNSLGKINPLLQGKIVNPDTNKEVKEPFQAGELWVKGYSLFKEYYNNPSATKEAFSPDGWFMTGDMFHKDEYGYYYYVERKKLLLKYNGYQISPTELESLIRGHPGVSDVAVVAVRDEEYNDLPVAYVIKESGAQVTAQEIKDLVKNNKSDYKQLRGGVIFVEELPLTPSMKIDRKKLKEMALYAGKTMGIK